MRTSQPARDSALDFDVDARFEIITVSYIGEYALELGNVKLCWAANCDDSPRIEEFVRQ